MSEADDNQDTTCSGSYTNTQWTSQCTQIGVDPPLYALLCLRSHKAH